MDKDSKLRQDIRQTLDRQVVDRHTRDALNAARRAALDGAARTAAPRWVPAAAASASASKQGKVRRLRTPLKPEKSPGRGRGSFFGSSGNAGKRVEPVAARPMKGRKEQGVRLGDSSATHVQWVTPADKPTLRRAIAYAGPAGAFPSAEMHLRLKNRKQVG